MSCLPPYIWSGNILLISWPSGPSVSPRLSLWVLLFSGLKLCSCLIWGWFSNLQMMFWSFCLLIVDLFAEGRCSWLIFCAPWYTGTGWYQWGGALSSLLVYAWFLPLLTLLVLSVCGWYDFVPVGTLSFLLARFRVMVPSCVTLADLLSSCALCVVA
jgi:hypothetical protein